MVVMVTRWWWWWLCGNCDDNVPCHSTAHTLFTQPCQHHLPPIPGAAVSPENCNTRTHIMCHEGVRVWVSAWLCNGGYITSHIPGLPDLYTRLYANTAPFAVLGEPTGDLVDAAVEAEALLMAFSKAGFIAACNTLAESRSAG